MTRIKKNIVNRIEDKAIFLFDKDHWDKNVVNLTRKECEKYVMDESYEEDYTIIKIDATPYNTIQEALSDNGLNSEYYFCTAFGIK